MFTTVKQKMQERFKEMSKGTLFFVNVDKDKIWNSYLDAFEAEDKQGNNCRCCQSFLRQYGGVVGIKDNQIITLWDFEVEGEYAESIKALRKYIVSLPIAGIFLNPFAKCGTDRNPDKVRNLIWNHFYIELPNFAVKRDVGPAQATALDNKNVLQRSLNEITDDAVDTVLELIASNSIYRGQEFKGMVTEFKKIRDKYKKVKGNVPKDNFCWLESTKTSGAVTRIRNSSIGTLLNDLSEGMDLDNAVRRFEAVVAPSSYKRPTALVTPRMIETAQKRLEELGLTGSLYRRLLSNKDLTVNNALFVHRSNEEGDIFAQLKKEVSVNPKSFSKVEEISIQDFIEKVIPTAKSIKVLVENKHLGNFVSLVGPKNDEDETLLKWGNNYSWSYTGEMADSMRERVVELGGRVDGVLRFTHSWNHPEVGRNGSLMDLHVFLPGSSTHKDGIHDNYPNGQRVGWNHRKDTISGGSQDVDYTSVAPEGYIPVENITFPSMSKLKDGKYTFKIHNWSLRAPTQSGFRAEIEFGGQIHQYDHPKPLKNKEWVTLAEVTLDKGSFSIDHKLETKSSPRKKWNISTFQFHTVKALTLSPNYWNGEIGNKHFMFFLDKCECDEKVRGFYNEMLKEDLAADRKVFEILGAKVFVEKTENELSGLGFSETVRNDLIVEVQGNFKRTLKIKF